MSQSEKWSRRHREGSAGAEASLPGSTGFALKCLTFQSPFPCKNEPAVFLQNPDHKVLQLGFFVLPIYPTRLRAADVCLHPFYWLRTGALVPGFPRLTRAPCLLSDRTVIHSTDYLHDGEQTGGFQFLAITKNDSLSPVPSGFFDCVERLAVLISLRYSLKCSLEKLFTFFVPHIWEHLAQRAN